MSLVCNDDCAFFVSLTPPHKSVSSQTLSRWVRDMLGEVGVDVATFQPHSCRAAAAAHLRKVKNLDYIELCRRADWSLTSGTYKKFYQCYV